MIDRTCMKRSLQIALVCIAACIAAAAALRLSDGPYIALANGDPAEAMDGLRAKAEKGDAFAAFLVGRNFETGGFGRTDRHEASEWYIKAARLGEIRSIARYIGLNLTDRQNATQCAKGFKILETAGQAGDLDSLAVLGSYFESGFCTETDVATAARYYMACARIDGRFNEKVETVVAKLDPKIAEGLEALPDKFDGTVQTAIAQFLAEVPFGTDATP